MVHTTCIRGMCRGHYGHPGPADDHWSERCLDHVCSVPEPQGNTLKGSMTLRDRFWIHRDHRSNEREEPKMSVNIRKSFGGIRKGFRGVRKCFGVTKEFRDEMNRVIYV